LRKGSLASLIELFAHLPLSRRRQFLLLAFFSLFVSLFEAISLGAVAPFVGVLVQPEIVFNKPYIVELRNALGIITPNDLIAPLGISFAVLAVVAGTLRVMLLYFNIKLSNKIGADISIAVYSRTLYQSYENQIVRNSSEVITGVTQKVETAGSLITSSAMVVTTVPLFIAILVTVFLFDPLLAITVFFIFGIAYGMLSFFVRRRLKRNSIAIASLQTEAVKVIQEGIGSIRNVILDQTHPYYLSLYTRSVRSLRQMHGQNTFVNQSPRFLMESLGIVMISIIVLVLFQRGESGESVLPMVGILAVSAQKLLPLLHIIYNNVTQIIGGYGGVSDVNALLALPPDEIYAVEDNVLGEMTFHKNITLNNINFTHNNADELILCNSSMEIVKGTTVGIVGKTGSGKSTLLDVIMALLLPQKGQLLVDDIVIDENNRRAWYSMVAHVPQTIYLEDATIANNIAVGVENDFVDYTEIEKACNRAGLADFVESLPDGINTMVGERGVRLSGGQCQRIGIARALYKHAEVLVLDEATSALDSETEEMVMKSVNALDPDLTIVIIAHRLTTLKGCDEIFQVENGVIRSVGKYNNLMNERF
jgi:ATP-binding cassette, subfamily B, bacterial PglK